MADRDEVRVCGQAQLGQDSKIAQVYRGIAMLKMIGDAWILSARLGGRK